MARSTCQGVLGRHLALLGITDDQAARVQRHLGGELAEPLPVERDQNVEVILVRSQRIAAAAQLCDRLTAAGTQRLCRARR